MSYHEDSKRCYYIILSLFSCHPYCWNVPYTLFSLFFYLTFSKDDLEAELACLEFDMENEEVFESNEVEAPAAGTYILL